MENKKKMLSKNKKERINSSDLVTDIENLESSELEEVNDLSYIPEEEREVFIDRVQLSVFELHRRCKRGDIILQPEYQRQEVWTRPKKSKLIESILRNIPIPSVYFAETTDDKWEVVDGQQRLNSLFDFLDNEFPLSQLPVLSQFEKKFFKNLDNFQRKIEDYQLHIFIIKKESHPDIRFDIFERINEGATQLNAQELRNSLYRGERIEFIKNLSKNPDFIKITKGKINEKRLKHQEAVLRFISFYLKGYKNYNGNLNSFLNQTLDKNLINSENYEEIEKKIQLTMKTINIVFGENSFIKPDSKFKLVNMALFDLLSYSFAKNNSDLIIKYKNQISNSLYNLIENDDDFKRSITANTLTKKNVNYKFDTWLKELENILSGRND